MSIPVDVAALRRTLADFGTGYLLTTTDGRVKVVTVDPIPAPDGTLRIAGPGKGTLGNLAGNPAVTLVFPPAEPKGFTLLVDGTAEVEGQQVLITASTAVLHRPAAHSDGPPAPGMVGNGTGSAAGDQPSVDCGNDCAPVS